MMQRGWLYITLLLEIKNSILHRNITYGKEALGLIKIWYYEREHYL
jgi:hypothetical protein